MKNTRISFILSIVAIVGVLSVWTLWLFGSIKVSVVDLGTFVGVTVALLAIIVTIVLGWQLINAIEVREKIAEMEQTHRTVLETVRLQNEKNQSFIKLTHNLQAGLCDASSDSYCAKGLFIEAFGMPLCFASSYSCRPKQFEKQDSTITIFVWTNPWSVTV